MSYVLVLPKSSADVVTLAEAKAYLRVTTTTDDTLIQSLITSAVQLAESYMNRDILTTTWLNFRNSLMGDWTLRRGGFQSVVSFEYLNPTYVVLPTTEYKVSQDSVFGIIQDINFPFSSIDGWPYSGPVADGIKITFKTGFGDTAASVPELIKTAIKMTVGMLYSNRGDCCGDSGLPKAVETMLNAYRIINLGFDEPDLTVSNRRIGGFW